MTNKIKLKKSFNNNETIKQKNFKTLFATYIALHMTSPLSTAETLKSATSDSPNVPDTKSNDIEFDPAFLYQDSNTPIIDISKFNKSSKLIAGKYRFETYINDTFKGLNEITINDNKDLAKQICIRKEQLTEFGINFKKINQRLNLNNESIQSKEEDHCYDILKNIPGSIIDIDQSAQKITLVIPEIFLNNPRIGTYADPSTWQQGNNGLLINYNSNFFQTNTSKTAYLGINSSANYQRWRLRHSGSLNWNNQESSKAKYNTNNTYLQTDSTTLKSQIIFGETNTNDNLFDSIPFKGMQLYSDDRMLEDIAQSYAPIIHGITTGNAKVSVYQKEQLIYETTVAPGPFEIDDIQAQTDGGDLKVVTTEANGLQRSFIVPYSYSPELLRAGQDRYNIALGKVHLNSITYNPNIFQGVLRHGFSGNWTGYTGLIYSKTYSSLLVGSALNLRLGTISVDITRSIYKPHNEESKFGNSIRIAFSKSLPENGTNISIASYRYSSDKYLTLSNAIRLMGRDDISTNRQPLSQKQRIEVNINQSIKSKSIYLNGSILEFWGSNEKVANISAGYSDAWKNINFSLAFQRSKEFYKNTSSLKNSISLNISIPFGKENDRSSINSFASYEGSGNSQWNTSISGRFNNDDNASYTAYGNSTNSRSLNGGIRLGYLLPKAAISAGMSSGPGYQHYSATAAGALIMHSNGITLSQATGETVALVHVPNGEGAAVGISKAPIDRNGYTVISNLTPYHTNKISLVTKNMPVNVELVQDNNTVVTPRAGAIMHLEYKTQPSYSTIISSTLENGDPLPYAASILDETGKDIGIVSQGSRVLVKAINQSGILLVKWGNQPDAQCTIKYTLETKSKENGLKFNHISETCHRY
ncbi:fimbria/pilus outer membrane usher protein [Aquitalea pelogenes]|uniref:fimbria/pilus outer membrane usher protein n=1 Tax=Aquitalea pelogenes TaxID=1293573 RepID=UPI0009E8082F|nr:fimbria/pilus outer membrane usher protein [Aquitalea pelogenes]